MQPAAAQGDFRWSGRVANGKVIEIKGDDGPNVCRPGEEGRMNTRRDDVKVDFTIRSTGPSM